MNTFLGYPSESVIQWIKEHSGPIRYNVIYADKAVVKNELKVNTTDDNSNETNSSK